VLSNAAPSRTIRRRVSSVANHCADAGEPGDRLDMLKRYHAGIESYWLSCAGLVDHSRRYWCRTGLRDLDFTLHNPAAPMSDRFLPASQWRAPADTSPARCRRAPTANPKMPRWRCGGARNLPCVDVPGKRAATAT